MEGEREREGQGWGKRGEVSLPHSKFLNRPLLQWHIRKIGLVYHPPPNTATIPPWSESLDKPLVWLQINNEIGPIKILSHLFHMSTYK